MPKVNNLLSILQARLESDRLINHKCKSDKDSSLYFPIEDIGNVNNEELEKIFELVISITNKLEIDESFEFLSQVLHLIEHYGQSKISSLIGLESEDFFDNEKSIINFIISSLKNKIIDYRESLIYSPSMPKIKKKAINITELRDLLVQIASEIGMFQSKQQEEDFADYMSFKRNTTKKQLNLNVNNYEFNYIMFESEKRLIKIYPELHKLFEKTKFFNDNMVFSVHGKRLNVSQFQKNPITPKYHKEIDRVIDKILSPLLEQRK